MLEELCGVPVLGVVPYYKDIHIEEEDSVALGRKAGGQLSTLHSPLSTVSVAVVLLRHLSNFTDFNVLERDPRVHLFYTNNTDDLLKSESLLFLAVNPPSATFTNCAVTEWHRQLYGRIVKVPPS